MDTSDQQITSPVTAESEDHLASLSHADILLQEPRAKRRPSLRGRLRRALRILEPFALVVGLGLLSAGVIDVVEKRVPTRADQDDSARLARAEARKHADQRAFALATAEVWRKSDLPDWQATAPRDHGSTISISSTSKTSAAPPGMLGGRPESP